MVPRNVAAMIHRHATSRIEPVRLNGTTYRHVIPTVMKWSGGIFPSSRLYLVLVHFPTWWIPPLRFAAVGMTYLGGGFVYLHRLYMQRGGRGSVQPNRLYSGRFRNGTQAVPYGFAGGCYRSSAQVVFETLLGDESSPLHCVVPFIRTGYIRNVAGGRLPPLHARWWVLPFIRTGCIRNVAWR